MAENLDSRMLLELVAAGDSDVAMTIYERYLERLVSLAQQRLSAKLKQRVDPEDAVQSAYRSFFVRAERGEFAWRRSGDLWRVLATLTIRKVYRNVERHTAERRDLRRDLRLGDIVVQSPEPTAEEVQGVIEQLELFMSDCDKQTRAVVEARLRSETIPEIATMIGRSERTVRRILSEAQDRLERMLDP